MVQPPSKQLQDLLFGKKLCSQRDLQGCVSRVKSLSADLPAFDSVWLDALVQNRKLTSFQVQTIESDETENLRIGPFIVVARLGHGPNGDTFLGRRPDSKELITIKRVCVPTELQARTTSALQKVMHGFGSDARPANLVLPTACNIVEPERIITTSPAYSISQGRTTRGVSRRPTFAPVNQVQFAIISRYVPGLPLTQLVLRRGRFDPVIVARIGRSVLESLSSLFQHNLVHGEITLGNVVLTHSGQVTLVDAGVAVAIQPEFHIDAFVEPHRNDGIAPELIGTGNRATQASDLYALGCLLWQLLAGRPAFPTGDPLAKLASHQTTRIPNIREIAPETPEPLANAIYWLTEPNPRRRPQQVGQLFGTVSLKNSAPTRAASTSSAVKTSTAAAVGRATSDSKKAANADPLKTHTIGAPKTGDRRLLAKFARSFHHPTVQKRPLRRPIVSKQMTLAVASVFLACCGFLVWSGSGRDWPVLSLWPKLMNPAESAQAETSGTLGTNQSSARVFQAWPEPDAAGVVELGPGGTYSATRLVWTGQRMTIRGNSENPPRIVVESNPLRLQASELILENVRVELAATRGESNTQPQKRQQLSPPQSESPSQIGSITESNPSPRAMLILESQTLTLIGCELISPLGTSTETTAATSANVITTGDHYAIAWAPLDATDQLSGQITITDSIIAGNWSTLLLAGRAHRVNCVNSIQAGPGPFFSLHQGDRPAHDTFKLEDTTLRESGGLVSIQLQPQRPWQSRLTIEPSNCVFSLIENTNGNSSPLLGFVGSEIIPHWHESIAIEGSSSLVKQGTVLAALQSADRSISKPLTNATPRMSGIISSSVQFRGNNLATPNDSVVTQVETNWRTETLPGIQPTSRFEFESTPNN